MANVRFAEYMKEKFTQAVKNDSPQYSRKKSQFDAGYSKTT
jgi:hypothetical protein